MSSVSSRDADGASNDEIGENRESSCTALYVAVDVHHISTATLREVAYNVPFSVLVRNRSPFVSAREIDR